MPNLTQKFIESLKPTDRMQSIPDSGMRGLELYVTKTGIKTFSVRYTLPDGTRRRMTLGRWPALTLVDARSQTLDILSQVTKGKDPAHAKKTCNAEARTQEIKTVRDLGNALIEASRRRGVRASTLTYWQWVMKKHINTRIGDYRALELTSKIIRPVLQDIGAEAGPVTSNRTLTILKRMYNFAVEEELLEANPLAAVKFAFKEISRERVLSETELASVWEILELVKASSSIDACPHRLGVSPAVAMAIQFCTYTCQRGSEIAGTRWEEIDLSDLVWIIPAARTKSKRENVVPLSPQAASVLRAAADLATIRYGRPLRPQDAVFPSPRSKRRSLDTDSLDQIHPIERLSLNRAMARVTSAASVSNATLHDLRRTGATMMASEKIGTLGEIVARILNHTSASLGVTGIYNRYSYVREKRIALNAWGDLIHRISGWS